MLPSEQTVMKEHKAAAEQLRKTYAEALAERGGDLEVSRWKRRLSAAVTWREANIYDHIDIELADRTMEEAVARVEDQIQEWVRQGPPASV